jgi:hypothetical protein
VNRIELALRIGVVCHAWYLFGFVYEEIVDVPNMIGSRGGQAQGLWDPYHWLTNPVHYYAVIALPAIACLALLWHRRHELPPADRRRLHTAIGGHAVLAVTTGIAVTLINDTLYFGPPIGDPNRVRVLALTWFTVNGIRIVGVACTTAALAGILLARRTTEPVTAERE